jgi:hypothetical protein
MRSTLPLAVFVASTLTSFAASPKWMKMQTENFEVFSSASPRATRDTIQYLEQVHRFFEQALGPAKGRPRPVRLVIFGSRNEFELYRPSQAAAAFYRPGAERDYIVMGSAGLDVFPLAIHEYVHLLVENSGLKLPLWLNEGIAELYLTMKPRGDKVLVGDLIPGRMQALERDPWVPLRVILSADHKSPIYNEKNRAGSLYGEAWALTHLLLLSEEYRDQFIKLVTALHNGADSVDALVDIYGRRLEVIEQDLRGYLRMDRFQAVLVPVKWSREKEEIAEEPAPEFAVHFTMAELMDRPGEEKRTPSASTYNEGPLRPFRMSRSVCQTRPRSRQAAPCLRHRQPAEDHPPRHRERNHGSYLRPPTGPRRGS